MVESQRYIEQLAIVEGLVSPATIRLMALQIKIYCEQHEVTSAQFWIEADALFGCLTAGDTEITIEIPLERQWPDKSSRFSAQQ